MSAPYYNPSTAYWPGSQSRVPPPRKPRRWPWVVLVVVVVLAGLFVAADRIALQWAEGKAASTLQSSQHLAHEPDVSVHGFPFLTQLLSGRYPNVTISDSDVQVNSGLAIDHISVDLHDVTVSNNFSQVNAARANADALIGYDSLSRALRMRVAMAGDGRIEVHPRMVVGGRSFSAPVTARVRTADDAVRFTGVTVGGASVPRRVAEAFDKAFAENLSLAGLPFNVRLTGADVTAAGVVLHFVGKDLSYGD